MLATPYALVCLPCAGVIVVGLGSLKFWCTLAQEILPRKLEYYLPLPCQKRHIDFDACYFLCSSLFALCRSDSCWVMEFKVLVYSSLNWPNSTWILLKQSYWVSRYETANKGWTLFTDVPLVRYLIDIHEKSTIKLHNTTNSIVQLLYTGACHTQCSFHFRETLFICNWFFFTRHWSSDRLSS